MKNQQGDERRNLRRIQLAARERISPAERATANALIVHHFFSLQLLFDAHLLFVYCSYRSEVGTYQLMQQAISLGKKISVPRTVPTLGQMQAVTITDPLVDLAPRFKGIPEPRDTICTSRLVAARSIEIAVIPGVAFDLSGHRLGYGCGYYDKFLAREAPQACRIGLAYSCQVVDILPTEPHDMPMDILVTEKEVYTWARR